MKIIIILMFTIISFSCKVKSINEDKWKPYCHFKVYQKGIVIDKICDSCSFESFSRGIFYYKNTYKKCKK